MDILDCMASEGLRIVKLDDEYKGMLSELILYSLVLIKAGSQKDLQSYWSFRDEIAIIGGIAVKGTIIRTHAVVQDKGLKQLYLNHMGIENTRLLAYDYIYCINMNANIEEMVNNCPTCLDFQAT